MRLTPAFVTCRIGPPVSPHPLSCTLIKAHIDSNQCICIYPFFLDSCAGCGREESDVFRIRFLDRDSNAPKANISFNQCRGTQRQAQLTRSCKEPFTSCCRPSSELSTAPFDVVHATSMRSITCSKLRYLFCFFMTEVQSGPC